MQRTLLRLFFLYCELAYNVQIPTSQDVAPKTSECGSEMQSAQNIVQVKIQFSVGKNHDFDTMLRRVDQKNGRKNLLRRWVSTILHDPAKASERAKRLDKSFSCHSVFTSRGEKRGRAVLIEVMKFWFWIFDSRYLLPPNDCSRCRGSYEPRTLI